MRNLALGVVAVSLASIWGFALGALQMKSWQDAYYTKHPRVIEHFVYPDTSISGDGEVILTWQGLPGVTAYHIWRRIKNGPFITW